MGTDVIMPALGMAQETGRVVRWLKAEGDAVTAGEPLLEVETDKVTVEIEAPASGTLRRVTAAEGQDVPVGQTIAVILAPEGAADARLAPAAPPAPPGPPAVREPAASPLAARLAAAHGVDLRAVTPRGTRIEKADVQAYLQARDGVAAEDLAAEVRAAGRILASPKARRLADAVGVDLAAIKGTGPGGAVLASDVPARSGARGAAGPAAAAAMTEGVVTAPVSAAWRRMAERTAQSWTGAPHFFLLREVNAGRLVAWRDRWQKRFKTDITFTDLLVKLLASALVEHPRLNSRWLNGTIVSSPEINIGLAVAIEEGLIVPVIHRADQQSVRQISDRRKDLVSRAQAGKLRAEDLTRGTFTISNLGMYGVDVFNAIINPPQAAILAVGRIADRVAAVKGRPAVRPMMTLSLSCDHRVVDGARGARFLETLADLIEEPATPLD
ncbi:MAG: 2-oxo acid dehydrogenase subunit E2 [Armatimonadetes bacterium]|nr:2-oxo acid dehydrogenase subunit E2 [Armatimonadota bacterium]